jgi:hypothetical protein
MPTTIHYNQKHLHHYLLLGTSLISIGVLLLFLTNHGYWFSILLFFGVYYFSIYIHKRINHYLCIDDTSLSINSFFTNKVSHDEIKAIHQILTVYTLQTKTKNISIDSSLMDEKSCLIFKDYAVKFHLSKGIHF